MAIFSFWLVAGIPDASLGTVRRSQLHQQSLVKALTLCCIDYRVVLWFFLFCDNDQQKNELFCDHVGRYLGQQFCILRSVYPASLIARYTEPG